MGVNTATSRLVSLYMCELSFLIYRAYASLCYSHLIVNDMQRIIDFV